MKDILGLKQAVQAQFDKRSHIAHGADHAFRVAQIAKHIALQENYSDPEVAEVAGLLHDMGRTVQEEEKDHGPAGVPMASEMLDRYTDYDEETKQQILDAIRDHSAFKAEGELTHILQDADKLDGLGAVGLMRAYTSKYSLPAYDPADIAPSKGGRNTTITEFVKLFTHLFQALP
ncbi:MAG TPA: HD domain-containing protein [Candidatus Saccharimonadales bacterium]